jgi:ABC-type multidrug transport system fused ATPase/permease subunit
LSALDSYVGKRIFHDVIEKELNGKTRIMATHQLAYLKYFKKVIILKDGEVVEFDEFEKIKANPNSYLHSI